MFFLSLTLGQFLALFAAASALVLTLYLLDRSRRRQVVATLRFWVAAQRAPETRRRRRIQQWPSLLLQILSLGLLLAGLGQLSCGRRGPAARDHVLILETSAWMAARTAKGTLIEEARELARACLRRLPARDRVMLVRADALATPVTAFGSDRQELERAIAESLPSATALRLEQALALAVQAQRARAGQPGEIIFVGTGRLLEEEADARLATPPNLRVLAVGSSLENCGLRRIGLERSARDPALWNVFLSVRNYGERPQRRRVALDFGGAPVGSEQLSLAPGAEQSATFQLRTRAAGWLEVRLLGSDALEADDRAVLELPSLRLIHVLAYTEEPGLLRPLLSANPWVRADYRRRAEYDPAAPSDIVILDRFRPPAPPQAHAIWIEPPAEGSPVAVRGTAGGPGLVRWRSDHPLGNGIRTRDLRLDRPIVFNPAPGDAPVAEVEAGPVIVARSGAPKTVVLGFHPERPPMRYELAAPLLFANMLRWMAPDAFRRWEAHAQSAGSVSVELAAEEAGEVRVESEDGRSVPFTLQQRGLRFFWAEPGMIRVLTGAGEMVYSLSLPQVAEARWRPPLEVRRSLPAAAAAGGHSWDLWRWLALAGGLCLLGEWLLYGRSRPAPLRRPWPALVWPGLRRHRLRKAERGGR